MKNADMPAMPSPDTTAFDEFMAGTRSAGRLGLSKREYFAGLAMQGMVASTKHEDAASKESVAKWSVQHANALLAELEKERTP